jgi:hypothetical protein
VKVRIADCRLQIAAAIHRYLSLSSEMSWEPAWVPDGRGGFRRNHTNKNNEDVEEGEESGEMKEPAPAKKNTKGDEDEEEGEITPLPSAGGPPGPGPGPGPPRSSSTGNLDFRAPYRGRGSNSSRFVANRDRPRQRNSFSGTMPAQRYPGPSTIGNSSFGREGGFSVGGNGAPPFSARDAQPPPPPPPPPAFRDPPSFRDPHSSRDIMDGPPPRAGREFRDFAPGQPSGSQRGDPGLFAGRDFRGEPPSLGRDFVDAPPSRDFRGDQAPPPPRDNRDIRGVDQPNFRGEPPLREFRDPPFRGPPGPPEPPGRDYRNDPANRDFRGPSDPMTRDYRGGDGPNRDFRDRNDSVSLSSRDFRVGNPPSKRDVFGRDPYQNPNSDRPPAMMSGAGDNREGYNAPPIHREPPSFGSNKVPASRDQPPYRDGPVRNPPFREVEPPYRDPASREGLFRDGPRDTPFRDGASRDPREGTPKDTPFQGASRDRDLPFGKRDASSSSTVPRDTGRDPSFGSREPYARGENLSDRGRPVDGPQFEGKKGDNKREPSFGAAPPADSNFGLKRLDSGVTRDQNSRMGGPSSGQRIMPPFHREGNRDSGCHVSNSVPLERESIPGKNANKAAHHIAVDMKLGQSGSSASPSSFPSASSNPSVGVGLKSTSTPAAARPTDPRRRPSKELVGTAIQQGTQPTLPPQEGSGNTFYPHSSDVLPASNLAPMVDNFPEKPPIPVPSHPARRMGSYSSLADNSSMPQTLMPTPPPPLDRTNSAGSRLGPGGFRSPLPRRSSDASPHSERGDYYGPPGGGAPQGRLRSPVSDRGRSSISGGAPSPKKIGMQNKQQTPPVSAPQHPPLAPVMTGRPPHFRQNDPRFKHHERVKAEQEAAYLSASTSRGEDIAKSKGRFDSRSEPEVTQGSKGIALGDEAVPGSSSQKNHVDTFGRTREWTENVKASINRPPNPTTGSPTRKQLANKALSSAPCQDQDKLATGTAQDRFSSADSGSLPANKASEKHSGSLEMAQVENMTTANSSPTSSSSEGPRSRSEDLPPLLTSSLGDSMVVERAEAAVQELGLVISTPLLKKVWTGPVKF